MPVCAASTLEFPVYGPTRLLLLDQPSPLTLSGQPLPVQPLLLLHDALNRTAPWPSYEVLSQVLAPAQPLRRLRVLSDEHW
eukprot:2909730-Rhodomonas_salina.1